MLPWQQHALGMVFLAFAVGFGLWARAEFASRRWPTAIATVRSHQQQLISHGSAVYVRGTFTVEGRTHSFTHTWGRDESREGRWVPPADLPAVGATVPVQYNPANPSEVELGPPPPWFNRVFPAFCAVLFLVGAAVLLLAPAQGVPASPNVSRKHR